MELPAKVSIGKPNLPSGETPRLCISARSAGKVLTPGIEPLSERKAQMKEMCVRDGFVDPVPDWLGHERGHDFVEGGHGVEF